ncbi:hypothetical protein AYK61_19950 [Rhodococcus sp. SBT000017]|nr:hypothetical protein AYK61_19950 [Rhodococcus sp. SBT000017]
MPRHRIKPSTITNPRALSDQCDGNDHAHLALALTDHRDSSGNHDCLSTADGYRIRSFGSRSGRHIRFTARPDRRTTSNTGSSTCADADAAQHCTRSNRVVHCFRST